MYSICTTWVECLDRHSAASPGAVLLQYDRSSSSVFAAAGVQYNNSQSLIGWSVPPTLSPGRRAGRKLCKAGRIAVWRNPRYVCIEGQHKTGQH